MAANRLQLRIRVLDHLNDIQDEATGTGDRYKVPTLNRFINSAVRFYTNQLNTFYQGYFNREISLDILANVRDYDLGNSFRSPVYEVRRTIDTLDYYLNPVHPYNLILSTVPVPNASWLPTYHLEGNHIVFTDLPSANELSAIRIKHQKKVADFTDDVTELDDQLYDAEECIVIKSAIYALKAKDVSGSLKDITGLESELKLCEAAFMTQVGNRYIKPDKPIPSDGFDDYLY